MQQLKRLEDLTLDERERNRKAADELVKDQNYLFAPPATTIPLEHRIKGVSDAGQSITFVRAKYLGWRKQQEEHMFLAETNKGKFFAPMFMCGGVYCIPISEANTSASPK